jgi:hypothetical protein
MVAMSTSVRFRWVDPSIVETVASRLRRDDQTSLLQSRGVLVNAFH